MTNVSVLFMCLVLAGPAPSGKAEVTLQAIEAQPGSNRTDGDIDGRLAAKLRVTLSQLGMVKPDLKSLSKKTSTLAAGAGVSLSTGPHSAMVTCKSVGQSEVTLTVEIFVEKTDPETGTKRQETLSRVEVTLKGDQAQPFVLSGRGEKKILFVVSARGT